MDANVMVKNLEKKVVRKLRAAAKFTFSHQSLPTLKGTLAYLLTFILIFFKRFDGLSEYPLAYSGTVIVVLLSGPGKVVGACIQSTALAIAGVSLGCVGFVILANLSSWPVVQGVVFAIIVYAMALVKSRYQQWFVFPILCILNSFNGVYTSYLLGGVFSAKYLKAYFEAYLWGAVICLGVNLLIFPRSSEKDLRQTLVVSLEHIGTFAHLLAKGYTLEITDEERAVREHLSQTIRADFGTLTQKIEETTIEINYSRFSLKDYQHFVSRTRGLQQALITAHSSLDGMEKQDVGLFKERFLPSTLTAFNKLRRAVDLTIRDLGNELGCYPMVIPMTQANYCEYMDLEREGVFNSSNSHRSLTTVSMESDAPEERLSNQLAKVKSRLAAEVECYTVSSTPRTATPDHTFPSAAPPLNSKAGDASPRVMSTFPSTSSSTATGSLSEKEHNRPRLQTECGIQRLRRVFDEYYAAQHDILQESLTGGQLRGATDDGLRLYQPRGSLREAFGTDGLIHDADGDITHHSPSVRKSTGSEKKGYVSKACGRGEMGNNQYDEKAEQMLMDGHSLIRVWGFLFALEQFVSELERLWRGVRPQGARAKKHLHIHFFEALKRPHRKCKAEDEDTDLPLPEALALLENKPYTPVKLNFWQGLDRVQQIAQCPTSVFAAKTAAAASVFGTLIYATVPRPWFINYALSPSILTIVVALAPTLGQSILTFILQVAGSGIGILWGLAVLEIFHNVGGHTFNPYGIICMLLPYALIMQYVLYEKPAFLVVALLGLNGTGVLIATEWLAVEYLDRTNFDSPALRAGKAISALMVALAIVAVFQLFILRNPARRTLRKKVAALTFETLSYAVLLQAFGRSVLSIDRRPCRLALLRVEKELRHRELKLQSALINSTPLVSFAAAEPQFSSPFRKELFVHLIRANQLVLDRLREARAALGTQQFERFILTHFVSVLAPYRTRNTRAIKAELYLVASSLQAKAPLPHDTPVSLLTDRDRADFIHDTLVLSARFAQTKEGARSIRSQEFMRYVSYLLCSTAVIEPLRAMEDASKQLFGELEDKLM